jgi:hypothetical protein
MEALGILSGFTEAPVDGHFDQLGDFVDVREIEILQQLGLDLLPIVLFKGHDGGQGLRFWAWSEGGQG